jgi:hypothetical protein
MAPLIAALLQAGLPLLGNAALSKGTEWLKENTGVDVSMDTTPTETQLAALKTVQEERRDELEAIRLENDRLATYFADVASARAMQEAALGQDDPLPKRFVYLFATGWSLFAAVYLVGITFGNIPAENVRFADTTLGFILGTIISQILSFFYGSSQGSVKNAQALRDLARKPAA